MYGMHVRFTAQPGSAEELAAILVESGEALRDRPDCLLYAVFRAPGDEHAVHVTEAWVDEDAHAASLAEPETRSTIERARPLIAGIDQTVLEPVGGKGLSPRR
jgi:quinol monooxygenase YgiN